MDLLDELLNNEDISAIVGHQYLLPISGRDAVISPPTYAPAKKGDTERVYNIIRFPDGRNICLIDSVPSQSNRIEQLFKRPPYSSLIPQINIKVGEKTINMLDAGHRAADAIVRFSSIGGEIQAAFDSFRHHHDATSLAKLAPISLLLGAWDSRGSQVKLQRIVRSVIYAYDVKPVEQTAQYHAPVDYVRESILEPVQDSEKLAQLGLVDSPIRNWRGGVIVQGDIRRDITVNLVVARSLGAGNSNNPLTRTLQRYILSLALVAVSAPMHLNLREGCLLTVDPDRPLTFESVTHFGSRTPIQLIHAELLALAQQAAAEFGVGEDRIAEFNAQALKSEVDAPPKRRTKKAKENIEE